MTSPIGCDEAAAAVGGGRIHAPNVGGARIVNKLESWYRISDGGNSSSGSTVQAAAMQRRRIGVTAFGGDSAEIHDVL